MSPEKESKTNSMRFFRKAKFGLDKFILIGRQKIHYIEAGKGDPVVLIPGSVNTYRAWGRLMPLLAADFRLLALDYPIGPGDLGKEADDFTTVRKWSEIVVSIITQLKLGKVMLVGWGSGGSIVFDMAARFNDLVEKIVTVSWYFRSKEETQTPRLDLKKWGVRQKSNTGFLEEIKVIKQPILYVYGTNTISQSSMSINLNYLQAHLPQTWIVELEGGIFELLLKNPQEIASLVTKFLHTRLEPQHQVG